MADEVSSGVVTFLEREQLYVILLNHGHFLSHPKGHVEEGEDYRQAAIRELKEETNLELQEMSGSVIESITYTFQSHNKDEGLVEKTVHFFAGIAKDTNKIETSFEHEGYKLVLASKAHDRITFDGDQEAFDAALHWYYHKDQ